MGDLRRCMCMGVLTLVALHPFGSPLLAADTVADTKFSVKRGFFTAPFQLVLSTATPGAVIRYTTDGSAPTQSNGAAYNAPLTINKTTCVRAFAFAPGMSDTNVDTNTYIFLEDVIV